MINFIPDENLFDNVPTVEHFNAYSYRELLQLFLNKLNEIIENYTEFEKNTLEELKRLRDKVENVLSSELEEKVKLRLNEMIEDGTLATLINVTVFEQLNEKIDKSYAKLNSKNYVKYRGYNFHCADSNYVFNRNQMMSYADQLIEMGVNSISLVIYLYINDENWNFTTPIHFDDVKYICEHLYNNGVKTNILKVHWLKGTYSELNYKKPPSTFINNLKVLYNKYIPMLKPYGLEMATVTNELPDVTNANSPVECQQLTNQLVKFFHDNDLLSTIAFVNVKEMINCDPVLLENLDVIGLNDYQPVSYDGLNFNLDSCINHLCEKAGILTVLKLTSKPCMVTETGCMDYVESMAQPAKWDYSTSDKIETDGVIQSTYYKCWLELLRKLGNKLLGIYFWDSCFQGFRPTAKTKELLKGEWK